MSDIILRNADINENQAIALFKLHAVNAPPLKYE